MFIHFNSIKVRLKPSSFISWISLSALFQFHKGTIKTFIRIVSTAYLCYFTSIKVRLKQDFDPVEPFPDKFQFHKGTIKTINFILNMMMSMMDFNSIKVRLKPYLFGLPFFLCRFQFHKGTIKTLNRRDWIGLACISIP